jgi:phosphomannomutase/phosphoglucomutase
MTNKFPPASIFRAYDIRGIVDKTLTEDNVYLIGQGFGSLVLEQGEDTVVMARDGRLSGPRFSRALSDGIRASGCHVIDLGSVPTPLLYFATHVLPARSGIMLTGSHNPPDYNGLKMVLSQQALAEERIVNLHQRICAENFSYGAGNYTEIDMVPAYLKHITSQLSVNRQLTVVVDAGSGITGKIAPALFRSLGCTVHELYCEIDGTFPYHHPDPSNPDNLHDLAKAVQKYQADIGLAFDGDGDRLGVVTNAGDIICPDRLLMLFAETLLTTKPQAKIIYDVKCTNHLNTLIKARGGIPLMWKTGHSLIKAKMLEIDAALGGEMSGHFFFKDRWFGFDDALYAGARLLEILAARAEKSSDIFAQIPNSVNTTELKVFVAEEEKFGLMKELVNQANFKGAQEVMTIDGLRVSFADGWGLIRPSNTTPYLVLRFEAINHAILSKIQTTFREWMLSVRPDLVLPF